MLNRNQINYIYFTSHYKVVGNWVNNTITFSPIAFVGMCGRVCVCVSVCVCMCECACVAVYSSVSMPH